MCLCDTPAIIQRQNSVLTDRRRHFASPPLCSRLCPSVLLYHWWALSPADLLTASAETHISCNSTHNRQLAETSWISGVTNQDLLCRSTLQLPRNFHSESAICSVFESRDAQFVTLLHHSSSPEAVHWGGILWTKSLTSVRQVTRTIINRITLVCPRRVWWQHLLRTDLFSNEKIYLKFYLLILENYGWSTSCNNSFLFSLQSKIMLQFT